MSDQATAAVLLCPGQGAQHVGMGLAWFRHDPGAAAVYREADAILGIPLSRLSFEGPAEELNRTDVAQAAIYTASVASFRGLVAAGMFGGDFPGDFGGGTAGLSLGEFTALHLAGALSFEDGLKLVRLRGQAMQDAAEAGESTMVAVTGDVTEERIAELCARAGEGDVLVPANFNSPMQVVVSGSKAACERAVKVAGEMGFKPTPLTVAGAFHSPFMAPAAERLAAALEQVAWSLPRVPVLSNVTGGVHEADVASIKRRLVEQLTSPVRWVQDMQHAARAFAGARFVELAPGKVLSGLMKRIERGVKVENHAEPARVPA